MANYEVITKTDIGSDPILAKMTLRLNKGLAMLKAIKGNKLSISTHKSSKS